MYFILRLTQLIVKPDSKLGALRYKIAPKCLLPGPFGHSSVGGNPGVERTVRSYNLPFTYPCQTSGGGTPPAGIIPSRADGTTTTRPMRPQLPRRVQVQRKGPPIGDARSALEMGPQDQGRRRTTAGLAQVHLRLRQLGQRGQSGVPGNRTGTGTGRPTRRRHRWWWTPSPAAVPHSWNPCGWAVLGGPDYT